MRKSGWIVMLVGLLVSTCAFGQGPAEMAEHWPKPRKETSLPPGTPPEVRQKELELQRQEALLDRESREAELNLQAKEDELDFRNEMRKIDLEKKKSELQRPGQAPCRICGSPGMGPGPVPAPGLRHGMPHRLFLVVHGAFLLVCAVFHILLTVWVYQDIRKRGTGSGLWIVITLISGFFGALLYALVRLGDKPAEK